MLTLLAAAALAGAPFQADPAAADRARTYEQLYKDSGNGALLWLAAEAHALAGQDAQAIAALRTFADARLGFEVTPDSPLHRLAGTADYDALAKRLAADARHAGDTSQVASLSVPGFIPEGIAADPASGRLFVGDMAGKRIIVRDKEGRQSQFRSTGALRPLGMKVDPAAGLLRVAASTAFIASEKPETALLSFDLQTGALKHSATSPDMRSINDLAIASNGDIYATDSLGGAVFRLRKGADAFERVTEAAKMSYPNGIAITPDGATLFVAQGASLRHIDIASGAVTTVAHPPGLALLSLDGLYWHDGGLVAVQNGAGRGRILRLELAGDLKSVTGFKVLEGSHPDFDIPTTGAIVGDSIVYIANSQLDHLEDDASISGTLTPIRLFRTGLGKPPAE